MALMEDAPRLSWKNFPQRAFPKNVPEESPSLRKLLSSFRAGLNLCKERGWPIQGGPAFSGTRAEPRESRAWANLSRLALFPALSCSALRSLPLVGGYVYISSAKAYPSSHRFIFLVFSCLQRTRRNKPFRLSYRFALSLVLFRFDLLYRFDLSLVLFLLVATLPVLGFDAPPAREGEELARNLLAERAGMEAMQPDEFEAFCRDYPNLLHPIYKLKRTLQVGRPSERRRRSLTRRWRGRVFARRGGVGCGPRVAGD